MTTIDNSSSEVVVANPYTFVEVTVQLADREVATFRREFGFDVDPLEKLEHLVDAVRDYLESD